MARKKIYKGVVIKEFRLKGLVYKVNDVFTTNDEFTYNHFINTKRFIK
jgi:hypothetical protein